MSELKKTITEPVEEEVRALIPTAQPNKEVETLVYVGPTIVGVASHSTIFNNGLPDNLKAAIDKEPAFKGLVIPVNRLADALKEIETKSGATFSLYEKVADYRLQEDS